jgi:hypothetical protein
MATKTFDEITQDFRSAAQHENLPPTLTASIVNLYRGPDGSIDAFTTWNRWYHAPPGDPIANLTISDIHKKFQKGTEDWERSLKALDGLWTFLADAANVDRASESGRRGDWTGLRTYVASQLEHRTPAASALLRALDTPVALAQKGAIRELLVETTRRCHDATAGHAEFLDSLEHGGIALAQDTKGVAGAIGWMIGGTFAAGGVAVACGLGSMPVAAVGCGLAAAGYCGYCLHRLYEDAW